MSGTSNRSSNSQIPDDDDDMTEPMDTSNQPGESSTLDDTITDRQQQQQPTTSPTTCHRHHPHYLFSQLKNRIVAHRNEHGKREKIDAEKNNGFVYVNGVDNDTVVISTDNADLHDTRHPVPCEHPHNDDDIVDISYNPIESSISTPIISIINPSHHEAEVLATQAGVECGTPNFGDNHLHDTQISTTDSSTSTNSSNNDQYLNEIDRSILNDNDYVVEQKRDLERITIYEIALNNDRRDYQQDLPQTENDQLDFNRRLAEARQLNLKLKDELQKLEEENTRIYSTWACELCTYLNEPYSVTRKDVCEMCEGPSPLKRHTLIT